MKEFEIKAKEYAGEFVLNKNLIHSAGFGSRAIPTYVGEWIIDNYLGDKQEFDSESREKISTFINKYLPQKGKRETLKNLLMQGNEIKILDRFSVSINLAKGERLLTVPFLDITAAHINAQIMEQHPMLLSSGLWGVGTLFYIPPDGGERGQVWLKEFKPFQIAEIDIEFYKSLRSKFSIEEWIDVIISSMGFNCEILTERQKMLLICRLMPITEPRYNLIELAPKGTGKSFVFDNLSNYVAVRAGNITSSVLFYNDSKKEPGLITRYDTVVLDEVQKIKGDNSGELTALLKVYLESGKFGRGTAGSINAEAALVLLANIDLGDDLVPINNEIGLFRNFPNFLRETAFIDRFAALLPGWDLPRITKDTPSKHLGLKGDVFSEILHLLRADTTYRDYIKSQMEIYNCSDMRDSKAIEAGASGLMKILFPNKELCENEFYKYCVNPAVEMRQRIRDELCKSDREFVPTTIKSKIPDEFQLNHLMPKYKEIEEKNDQESNI